MQAEANFDTASLVALGAEVLELLRSENFRTLAERYGYAIGYGREPAAAIQEDLTMSLVELRAKSLAPKGDNSSVTVKYFESSDSKLVAVVECLARTDNDTMVLVELILAGEETDMSVYLEQISAAA